MTARQSARLCAMAACVMVLGVVAILVVANHDGPAPDAGQGTPVPPVATVVDNSADEAAPPAPEEAALDANIRQAMEDFAYHMRFPPYSAPISAADWQALNPRAQMDRAITLMDDDDLRDGPGDVHLQVTVERGIVDVGKDLPVQVRVAEGSDAPGLLQVVQASVSVSPDNTGIHEGGHPGVPLTAERVAADNGAAERWEFHGEIPSGLLQPHADTTVYLVAQVTLSDGAQGKAVLPVELFESKAEIARVGDAYVEGPHLVIPFEMTAHVAGGFNVRANLLDESGDTPIAHLSETLRAETPGRVSGRFRAHIATLKEQGDDGPYQLATINITKTLTRPDYQGGYGAYDDTRYEVSGFAFQRYEDEDYVDPVMARRLEGLQRMLGDTSGADQR